MPQTDGDKLKAFVQKMHNEGAAGFAAGPWSLGSGGDATGAASRSNYHSRPSRTRRLGTPGRRLADRLLSGLAMLSIAAIIVGIGGIYLTEEPGQLHVAGSDSGRVQTALRQPDEKQLREIKQKLLLTSNRLDSLAAEFRRLKRHANTATAADEQRLQVLENRLLLTVTRLDTLSAEILDLKQVNNMILAATTTAPPAALARETGGTPARSTVRAMPPAQATPAALFGPGKLHPAEAPMATPIPAASPTPEPQTVAAASPEPEKIAAANPAPEPQPEPQTAAATSPAPEPQPEPQTVAATSPAPEPQPEPQTAATTSPAPEKVAAASPAPGTSSSPTTGNAGGDWVVNIASYSRQKTANRHVAELQQSGISAERVEAMVDGRRIHRVRVAGLASRSAARARAGALKQELDLPGIWIGKR